MTSKRKSNFRKAVVANAQSQEKAGSSYGYLNLPRNISIFNPKPGARAWLDFIPYEVVTKNHPDKNKETGAAMPGELWYRCSFKTHRNIGAGKDSVICLTSFGKACPICEHRAKLMKSGADKDDTDALRPSSRSLYIVIPLKSDEHEKKPHLMDISDYLFQKLLNQELSEDEDNGIFPDLEEGLTLKIRFDASQIGSGKPFAEASRIDFLERDEQYDESILKNIPDLDSLLQVYSYDELEAIYFNLETENEEEDEEEENEEEKPKRRNIKIKDSEPEEEADEEDEEEENEEEKPKEKPKRERKKETKKINKDDRCPKGHRFGIDVDKEEFADDCDACKLWDKCIDEKESK